MERITGYLAHIGVSEAGFREQKLPKYTFGLERGVKIGNNGERGCILRRLGRSRLPCHIKEEAKMLRQQSLALWAAIVIGSSVQAAPLDLILEPIPDITSGILAVGYSAGTDTLSVSGFALSLLDGAPPVSENILSGSFSINLTVDVNGDITPGVGSLVINGNVAGGGPGLLTGSIAQFGFLSGGGEIFEFLFDVTGGDLAGSFGTQVGVIVDAQDTGFDGSFAGSFSNFGFGVSDTGVIPEPATLGMVISGVLCLVGRRRRHG